MGGALIILALLFSTLMMADIANRYVLLALLAIWVRAWSVSPTTI